MVQKKGGAGNKFKGKGPMKAHPPTKTFNVDAFEDDDDDDLSDIESDESLTEPTPTKKTPKRGLVTPAKASAMATPASKKKDVHVSFQLQNKETPGKVKTPKGTPQQKNIRGTPMPAKQMSGKNKAIPGVISPGNPFGGKVDVLDQPIKGKTYSAMKKWFGDKNGGEEDDDEDDSDDDDFDEDDDLDLDEEDDDGIDEEGDEDEEDDEDLEDDDDLDSEGEEKLRQEILKLTKKTPEKDAKAANASKQKLATPKSVKNETSQKAQQQAATPKQSVKKESPQKAQPAATPASNKKQPKTLLKNVQPASNEKSPVKEQKPVAQTLVVEKQRESERDKKNLFVRGLPTDCTVAELKTLTPDILDVTFPNPKYQKKNKKRNLFAFLEFANEKKAEENYTILQNKTFRGQKLFVDFAGAKSKNRGIAATHQDAEQKVYSKTRLFVTGLPSNASILDIAQIFPKAHSITLNNAPEYRNATVSYLTPEDATAAFEANSNCKVDGRVITVLYSVEHGKAKKKRQKAQKRQQQKQGPPAKRMKMDPKSAPKKEEKEEESDYDDDDDDESDEE